MRWITQDRVFDSNKSCKRWISKYENHIIYPKTKMNLVGLSAEVLRFLIVYWKTHDMKRTRQATLPQRY